MRWWRGASWEERGQWRGGKGVPLSLCRLGSSDPHKDLYKGPLALRGGDKWRRKGGDRRDPRAGNAPSVGMGSKMEVVLTVLESATKLRGRENREGSGSGVHAPMGRSGEDWGPESPPTHWRQVKGRSLCKADTDIIPHSLCEYPQLLS